MTATRRLQRFVLERYADVKQGQGQLAWPTPRVLFWEDWLSERWREVAADGAMDDELPLVLNEDQELWVWEEIIRDHVARHPEFGLLQPRATARAARRAWYLMRNWNLGLEDLDHDIDQDTAAFRIWAREFSRRGRERVWLSRSELAGRIPGAANTNGHGAGGAMMWLGFDTLTPSQQQLRQRLNDIGTKVEVVSETGAAGTSRSLPCRDPRHEIESAARWARGLLEHGEPGSIGIVFLDLAPVRDDLEYIFNKILHPELRMGGDPSQHRTFHLSLGRRLVQVPVVAHALLVLGCVAEARPTSDMSDLILSPFIAGGFSEHPARAVFDVRLRKSGSEQTGLGDLKSLLTAQSPDLPILGERLDRLLDVAGGGSRVRSPAAWTDLFSSWLRVIGWPGDRVPNSAEYQAIEAWRDSLARFARLGLVTAKLGLCEAIGALTRMVSERIFQPRMSPALVQIMGINEAGGMEFDHLWLAGMSNDQWPPAPHPNPFVPHALQRRHGMPAASAKLALDYATIVTSRLMHSAAQIVVSYPQRRGELILKLSPLFNHVPKAAAGDIPMSEFNGYGVALNRQSPVLDDVVDRHGPRLSPARAMPGGVGVIRDQAACPFRAFARHRLRAEVLPEIEPGLNAAERGSIVHHCLARIWRRLEQQSQLLRTPPQALRVLITDEVSGVLSNLAVAGNARFHREFINLERRRLVALIEEWLEIERTRPPFTVIATEQQASFAAAGIEFLLRADRVDRCEDGSIVIIDYKTGGNTSVKQWFDDRPGDPQLPVYLLAFPEPVGAIAFADVRRGQCAIKGLGATALVPGIRGCNDGGDNDGSDWEQQQRRWCTVIERLVAAIGDGDAAVDPKSPNECQYCDVWAVCRVFETINIASEEDVDE